MNPRDEFDDEKKAELKKVELQKAELQKGLLELEKTAKNAKKAAATLKGIIKLKEAAEFAKQAAKNLEQTAAKQRERQDKKLATRSALTARPALKGESSLMSSARAKSSAVTIPAPIPKISDGVKAVQKALVKLLEAAEELPWQQKEKQAVIENPIQKGKFVPIAKQGVEENLSFMQGTPKLFTSQSGKNEKKKLLAGKGEQPIAKPSGWLPFLKSGVSEKLQAEDRLRLSINVDITSEKFKTVCKNLKERVKDYQKDEGEAPFKNLKVKEKSEKNNQKHVIYDICRGVDEKSKSIVQISHAPEANKINIVLVDIALQDEALFLMVVSAKKLLETLGKKQFNIEYCEDKPEIALKLYLIGKSLGIDPVFKDRIGREGETLSKIKASKIKLKVGENGEEKTLGEIYEEAELLKRKALKEHIGQLKIKRE